MGVDFDLDSPFFGAVFENLEIAGIAVEIHHVGIEVENAEGHDWLSLELAEFFGPASGANSSK